ncbi:MAG: hypothetical protein ACRDZ3_10670 [Acidimicrobiia bacterium]
MLRNTRRVVVATLALGLGLAGTTGAQADPLLGGFLGLTGLERVVEVDVPDISDDVEGGLAGLLGGNDLLGELLGGSDGLVEGLFGGLGLIAEETLSIQPTEPIGGANSFVAPRVGGGLLGGLLNLGSITHSLAGQL